jgi:DNA-binding transcriptional LysR family regulator
MTQLLDDIPWARRLKLKHLEVFLVLHETGSLTTAAARLHMTQPAMSHWLSDLEDAVGRPLFLRNRRLELTREGEVLKGHAARMLGDVRRTHTELQAVQAGARGRLHVGTGLPRVLLPKAIARLQDGFPEIFVTVLEAPMPTLLDQLAKRHIDLIIGALSAEVCRSGFEIETLMPDSVVIVARCKHPLFDKATLTWADTLGYPWILPPVGAVMREAFDTAFAEQHLKPPIPCVEANSSIRVQMLMEERNYLSILSASEVQLYRPLKLIDQVHLQPDIPFPDIGAVWEAERHGELMARFLQCLRVESQGMDADASYGG